MEAKTVYCKLTNSEGRTLWYRDPIRECLAMLAKYGYTYEPVADGTTESADIVGHFRQTSGRFTERPTEQFVTLWITD